MKCDAKRAGAFGKCSDDQVEVWHGYAEPAFGCGRHVAYALDLVFAGHRQAMAS
jgi:hypothetical protein